MLIGTGESSSDGAATAGAGAGARQEICGVAIAREVSHCQVLCCCFGREEALSRFRSLEERRPLSRYFCCRREMTLLSTRATAAGGRRRRSSYVAPGGGRWSWSHQVLLPKELVDEEAPRSSYRRGE